MTVEAIYEPERDAGDNIQVVFSFAFKTLSTTAVKVYKVLNSTNVKTLQVKDVDYSIVLNTITEGGVITYTVAPTTLEDSLIELEEEFKQPTDIPEVGGLRESQLENEYDRSRILDQQLLETQNRTLKQSVEDSTLTPSFSIILPTLIAGRALKVNAGVTAFEMSDSDIDDLDTAVSDAEAAAAAANVDAAAAAGSASSAAGSANAAATSATDAANSATTAQAVALSNLVGEIAHWKVLSGTGKTITVFQKTNLRNRDGGATYAFQGDVTADLDTSGKNGLDTGSAAADTWYVLAAIFDSTSVNDPAVLFVDYANYPTIVLPSGYDEYRRIGYIRNYTSNPDTSNAGFIDGVEHHEDYTYFENSFTFATVTGSAAYDALPFIPPTCTQVTIFNDTHATTTVSSGATPDPMIGDRDYNPGGVHGTARNITLVSTGSSAVRMLKYRDTLTENR